MSTPKMNTSTLKQFNFVFEKDLFILYLPFARKSPGISYILYKCIHTDTLTHFAHIPKTAFLNEIFFRVYVAFNQLLLAEEKKKLKINSEYEQNNLCQIYCMMHDLYLLLYANRSTNNAHVLGKSIQFLVYILVWESPV